MNKETLTRFKDLLSVPSKTYQEDQMVEYISWVLDTIPGVEYYTDEMNNIYATKKQEGFNGHFPMFIAHTDTVHSLVPEIVVEEQYLPKPPTFGKTFDDTEHHVLKAYMPDGNPTGIGGDDKAGIFICLELLRVLSNVKVGLFVSEETGCHGSSKCDIDFLNDVGYAIQFDAPGDHLITEYCSGVQLFERDSEFGERAIRVIENTMGTKLELQSHPYTDVSQIKMKSDFVCLNMSCGYYNMHTANEFISTEDVDKAIRSGINLVNELGFEKYEYHFKKNNLTYGYGNLFDVDSLRDDDFDDWDSTLGDGLYDEEDTMELDDNIVHKEWSGVSIISKHTGESVWLSDEECASLYEIIREKVLFKGVE